MVASLGSYSPAAWPPYKGWKPQPASGAAARAARMPRLDHDIDDPIGHDDRLARRLAGQRSDDIRQRERRLARVGLADVARHFDRATEFAVDLDRKRHRLGDGERGVGLRPRLIRQ